VPYTVYISYTGQIAACPYAVYISYTGQIVPCALCSIYFIYRPESSWCPMHYIFYIQARKLPVPYAIYILYTGQRAPCALYTI
jgi:hypothetical protein